MTGLRTLLWVVFVLFMAVSIEVGVQFGAMGLVDEIQRNGATTLLFVDLSIALTMMLVVVWRDASRHGRTFWPFAVLTFAFGSAGPLLYFALHGPSLRRDRAGAEAGKPGQVQTPGLAVE